MDELEDGRVGRAAADAEDKDRLAVALLRVVAVRRGRRDLLVDGLDAAAPEAAPDARRKHHVLPPTVGEVTGHGDDSVADVAAQVRLRPVLQLRDEDDGEMRDGENLHLVVRCLHLDGGQSQPLHKPVRHKLHGSLHLRVLKPAMQHQFRNQSRS